MPPLHIQLCLIKDVFKDIDENGSEFLLKHKFLKSARSIRTKRHLWAQKYDTSGEPMRLMTLLVKLNEALEKHFKQ